MCLLTDLREVEKFDFLCEFVRVKSACVCNGVCACAKEKGSSVEQEKFKNIKKLVKLSVRN